MKNSRLLKVMPVGTILVAAKDMFMDATGEQWLTKGEEYTIVAPPSMYNYPIEIIDDKGTPHLCALSSFSHIQNQTK